VISKHKQASSCNHPYCGQKIDKKEIDKLLLTADGEAHDALCEEHDNNSDRIYALECEDEEYDDGYNPLQQHGLGAFEYGTQHHRL